MLSFIADFEVFDRRRLLEYKFYSLKYGDVSGSEVELKHSRRTSRARIKTLRRPLWPLACNWGVLCAYATAPDDLQQ